MKRLPTARAGRTGFTLIELLTVVCIIGILAGILIPVLSRSKERAHELAAKDLCAQAAAAWTTLALNNHRFPSQALLAKYAQSDVGQGVQNSGGDLFFCMDPGLCSVLNWWSAKVPVPEGDVKHFKPKYTMGARKGQEITTFDGSEPKIVESWPADQLLERSLWMKCYGLYAPSRHQNKSSLAPWDFKAYMEGVLAGDGEFTPEYLKILRKDWDHALVRVIIDFNADGKVTLPQNDKVRNVPQDVAVKAGLSKDERDLPMTAAAWVYTQDRNGNLRILTSW